MKTSIFIPLILYSAIGNALDVPDSSMFDPHIQYVNYNAADVVLVRTAPGLATRIVFSPDETVIKDIGSGFTKGWELSDSDNILYVKAKSIGGENGQPPLMPQSGDWDTNLVIKTNKRLYDFELRLLPGSSSGKPSKDKQVAYRIEFRYPEDELEKTKRLAQEKEDKAKLEKKPEPKNWNYSMQVGENSNNITPSEAYDDGRFTYLKFPYNQDFPAVFSVSADKMESLVNTHVDKDRVLVIHRISPEFVLRLGNSVVNVYNDAFGLTGTPPNEGTTIPGLKRIIISDSNSKNQPAE